MLIWRQFFRCQYIHVYHWYIHSVRIAAAKKYGLIVEDYKPYPKGSDVMAGDYPDLPLVPEFNRSRLYEWDYPEFRR